MELKNKVNLGELVSEVDEVILMDVHRSFNNIQAISSDSMISILRCYALHNPEIEYCQGMNFIIGFLILIFKNQEDHAFQFFVTLVEKFQMGSLFKENVPLLRLYFYQMERLIAIHLPNLHSYLKVFIHFFTCRARGLMPHTFPPHGLSLFSQTFFNILKLKMFQNFCSKFGISFWL